MKGPSPFGVRFGAARGGRLPVKATMLTRREPRMTTIFVHRDDADANPEFVAALERAGAEVLVVDIDPAELAGVTIAEADLNEGRSPDWDRELGGASDGYTVHSDADASL